MSLSRYLVTGLISQTLLFSASVKVSHFQPDNRGAGVMMNFASSWQDPEEIARNFISSQTNQLGYISAYVSEAYDTQDLSLQRVEEQENATHVIFQQELDGIPVFGQQLKVHLRGDQSVLLMNGQYVNLEDTTIQNRGSITSNQALTIARRNFKLKAETEGSIEEVFIPSGNSLVRGYKALFIVPGKGEFVALVEGTRGNILKSYNQVLDTPRHKGPTQQSAAHSSEMDNFRKAKGPELAAEITLGRSVNSQRTAKGWIHSSSFKTQPEIQTVELKSLKEPSKLCGDAVSLVNKKQDSAVSEDGQFLFTPDSSHYDEVMVYYHITEMTAYLKSIGVDLKLQKPTTATVHYNDDDNSFYSPARKELFFGDGGVPDSADADIILHEFGHAIVDHLSGLEGGWGSQGSAMHEGYGDYVAASFFNDPEIGEWDSSAYTEDGFLRNVNNQKRFPEDMTNNGHDDGEIWSGTLWDLFQTLGKEVSDRLVYHSLRFLPQDANFRDGLVAILSADETLFKGKFKKSVIKVFGNRGILLEEAKEKDVQQARFNDLYTD